MRSITKHVVFSNAIKYLRLSCNRKSAVKRAEKPVEIKYDLSSDHIFRYFI